MWGRPSPVVGYLLVAAQMKNHVSEADESILCWLSLPLASLWLSSLLLLLLPTLKAELVFLSFHRGLGTSGCLENSQASGTRLGLLRHPALWTVRLSDYYLRL